MSGLKVTRCDMAFPRAGWWACPDCRFRRFYATDGGALAGAAQHMLAAHRARLWLLAGGAMNPRHPAAALVDLARFLRVPMVAPPAAEQEAPGCEAKEAEPQARPPSPRRAAGGIAR